MIAAAVSAAQLTPGDRVLEIGPGTGALTTALLAAGADVTAVEKVRGTVRETVRGIVRETVRETVREPCPRGGRACAASLAHPPPLRGSQLSTSASPARSPPLRAVSPCASTVTPVARSLVFL